MTSAFITSPHLPPQAVVLSVAVSARSTAGVATAAATAPAEAMKLRRVMCFLLISSSFSQPHIGAQPDQPLEREDHCQRQRDRHHRGRRDGAVEIEADVVEQDNRQSLAVRYHQEQRDGELIERNDEGEMPPAITPGRINGKV